MLVNQWLKVIPHNVRNQPITTGIREHIDENCYGVNTFHFSRRNCHLESHVRRGIVPIRNDPLTDGR